MGENWYRNWYKKDPQPQKSIKMAAGWRWKGVKFSYLCDLGIADVYAGFRGILWGGAPAPLIRLSLCDPLWPL